jgi:tyrosine-protein kinase Etk/Wzc
LSSLRSSYSTKGKHLRQFVESRLTEVEGDLKAAQDSLTAFQKRNGLPMVNPETGADIQAFSDLKSRAIAKELELEYMRTFSTVKNPQYEATSRELMLLNAKLASLPPLASRYLELYRDFQVQQQIYILLVQQYEQAKLMEAKDTPLISVLEWAKPAEEPVFPQKKLVVVVFFVVGLVLIFAYALIRVYWENVTTNPGAHKKMSRFRSELKETFGRNRR